MATAEAKARDLLSDYVETFPSQKNAARRLGISAAYLSDLIHQKRDVPDRLLRKLGYRYETQIVKVTQ